MKKAFFLAIAMVMAMLLPGLNPLRAATYYWVGGTGTWSDYSNHWATSSGGTTFHTQMPGAADDVVFDANSFLQADDTVYIDQMEIRVSSFTYTQSGIPSVFYNIGPSSFVSLISYGHLILNHKISIANMAMDLFIRGGATSPQILKLGKEYPGEIDIDSSAHVSWVEDSVQCLSVTIQSSEVNISVKDLSTPLFSVYGYDAQTIVHLNQSSITAQYFFAFQISELSSLDSCSLSITEFLEINNANSTLKKIGKITSIPGSISANAVVNIFNWDLDSLIVKRFTSINNNGIIQNAINLSNLNLNNQSVYGGRIEKLTSFHEVFIVNNYTIDTLILNNYGHSLSITNSKTLVVNYIYGQGSCDSPLTIKTTPYGDYIPNSANYDSSLIVCQTGGLVNITGVTILGIHATGGASFNVNNAIISNGANGWNVITTQTTKTLYWVNGSGNWSDLSHWSLASGGQPSGCIPSIIDDVVIDNNSFASGGGNINFDITTISLHNITIAGLTSELVFTGESEFLGVDFVWSTVSISGNVFFDNNVRWEYSGLVNFTGNETNRTLNSGKAIFKDVLFNNQQGSIQLTSHLYVSIITIQRNGTLRSNGYDIITPYFITSGDTLDIEFSVLGGASAFISFENSANNLIADLSKAHIIGSTIGIQNEEIGKVTYKSYFQGSESQFVGLPGCEIGHLITNGINIVFIPDFQPFSIDTLTANADISISDNFICTFADFRKNVIIENTNMAFNTLLLNNSGYLTKLPANDTVFAEHISISVCDTIGPNIMSTESGTQSTLFVPNGTVCMNYATFQDLNAAGSAAFYAGYNSSDNGNNTGLTFTSCANVSYSDTIKPLFVQPNNLSLQFCPDSPVEWSIEAFDNCGVSSIVSTPASGSVFPGGTTTVHFVVTDNSGNTCEGNFTVTLLPHKEAVINPIATTSLNTCAFGNQAHIVRGYGNGPQAITLQSSLTNDNGGNAYLWTPATYLSDSSAANPTFTPPASFGSCGVFTYTVTIIDSTTFCSYTQTVTINVVDVTTNNPNKVRMCVNGNNQSVPLNLVPQRLAQGNCLGWCNSSCSSFSRVANASNEESIDAAGDVKVVPNPSNGVFSVNIAPAEKLTPSIVQIYDLTGKLVYTQTLASSELITTSVDLSMYGAGIYLLRVSNGDFVYTEKIAVSGN